MLYPFRFACGDTVRPTDAFLAAEKAKGTNRVTPQVTGTVVYLTLDERGTYASVKFNNDARILVSESEIQAVSR